MEEFANMSLIEDAFLEEYKRLDKLCSEIYQTRNGISTYIEDMKNVSHEQSRHVSQWNEDLQHLRALRSLRNRLVHECGTLDMDMCSACDVDWLKSFYQRILHCTDPLALLHKRTSITEHKSFQGNKLERPSLSIDEAITRNSNPIISIGKHVSEAPQIIEESKKHKHKPVGYLTALVIATIMFVFACIKVLVILL